MSGGSAVEESRVACTNRDAEAERNHNLENCRRRNVHKLFAMVAEPMLFANFKYPVGRAADEGRWPVFLWPRHCHKVNAIR